MNKLYATVFFFCAVFLTGSTWLIGSHTERVEQFLRDGRFEAAAAALEAMPKKDSPAYVRNLTTLKLRIGDVGELSQAIGSDDAALKTVGKEDLLKLERASLIFSPIVDQEENLSDSTSLRETAFLSRLSGESTGEKNALQKIATHSDVSPEEIIRLAELQANSKNDPNNSDTNEIEAASETLALLSKKFPDHYSLATFNTEIALRLAAHQDAHDVILQRARDYIQHRDPQKTSYL